MQPTRSRGYTGGDSFGQMTDEPLLHPILHEEEAHLARIREHLLEHPDGSGPASHRAHVAQMSDLLHAVGGAKHEDIPSILNQFEHLARLVDQLRFARRGAPIDPDSPYFGHLQLTEAQ